MITRVYVRKRYFIDLTQAAAIILILVGMSSGACAQEIHVKFVDGETGRPVTYESSQIWVGSNTRLLLAPANNKNGTATYLYTGHSIRAIWPSNSKMPRDSARELTIPSGFERIAAAPTVAASICWDRVGTPPANPWYSINEILQHGAVSENHCGTARVKAKPGELILFIKPVSFWRRFIGGFSS